MESSKQMLIELSVNSSKFYPHQCVDLISGIVISGWSCLKIQLFASNIWLYFTHFEHILELKKNSHMNRVFFADAKLLRVWLNFNKLSIAKDGTSTWRETTLCFIDEGLLQLLSFSFQNTISVKSLKEVFFLKIYDLQNLKINPDWNGFH